MVSPGDAVTIQRVHGWHLFGWKAPVDRGIKEELKSNMLVLYEPDVSVRDALTVLLQGEGWNVECVTNCEELGTRVRRGNLVAVISESSLPDCTPSEVLELSARHDTPVIFTGHELSLQGAVDLIRQGALDFLDKPFPQSRLLDLLQRLN